MVKCKSGFESKALHDGERDAVGEGEILVVVALKPGKTGFEVRKVNGEEGHQGAGAQTLRDRHRARVVQALANHREGLSKNVSGAHQGLRPLLIGAPMGSGFPVVLIVGVFEGEGEARIEKKRPHASFPYRYSSCRTARSPRPLCPGLEPSPKMGSSGAGMGCTTMRTPS